MLQSRFDRLRERLLRAGIAPRHVRRYIAELRDHFDDLVRAETTNGATHNAAEATALARLGSDDDLAKVMLARPELRSVASRFPWAVFGLGSFAMLAASVVGAILIEGGVLSLTSNITHAQGWTPTSSQLKSFIFAVEIWNTLAVYVAPLAIAALLCLIAVRQRMSSTWIIVGVAAVCIIGGFENISWYDTGTKGELSMSLGFLAPYPHFAQSVLRAAANLAIAGIAWLIIRRPSLAMLETTQPVRE